MVNNRNKGEGRRRKEERKIEREKEAGKMNMEVKRIMKKRNFFKFPFFIINSYFFKNVTVNIIISKNTAINYIRNKNNLKIVSEILKGYSNKSSATLTTTLLFFKP